ncbi:MAG: hypothetical protein A3F18_04355 [Legionellales bacterium RIFCSPHIGHO2_12_FULL_37_14]|nr:MAG: hypothetical protein A3F18_04355 [Legionellales bacterium RIFCSPHIGHO2_12_FULL_37_14]
MQKASLYLKPYADMAMSLTNEYDIVIIGGGIHGAAAALNAAGRGLKVLLLEKDDLAEHTSSASSKLIHGGLRYLEHGQFSLVIKALKARENLLRRAPHLVKPLKFVLPLTTLHRAQWQIKLGLKMYDFFSGKENLPPATYITRKSAAALFSPLNSNFENAFTFYDAKTDDARLTIENALLARQLGAEIKTHTQFIEGAYANNAWQVSFKEKGKRSFTISAKAIINTAGPWVNEVLRSFKLKPEVNLAWIKGSHFIVPPLYPMDNAYILQHTDNRVVFCIPYHGYSMIGTTEQDYTGSLDNIVMDQDEASYLFNIIKLYFKTPYRNEDIKHHFSGVRTFRSQNKVNSKLSRESYINVINAPLPIVSLYGGKLTTHADCANRMLEKLIPSFLNLKKDFSPNTFPGALNFAEQVKQLQLTYHWLPEEVLTRYISQFGSRTAQLLQGCNKLADLGIEVCKGLYEQEINFLVKDEWATSKEDILWRRTKLGLQYSQHEGEKLGSYLEARF